MPQMTAQEVKDARVVLGMTQQQLADALDLESKYSKEAVRGWERGHRRVTGPAGVAIRLMLELHEIKAKRSRKPAVKAEAA